MRVYLAPAVGRYMREDDTYGERKRRCMLRKAIEDVLSCGQVCNSARHGLVVRFDTTWNFTCSSHSCLHSLIVVQITFGDCYACRIDYYYCGLTISLVLQLLTFERGNTHCTATPRRSNDTSTCYTARPGECGLDSRQMHCDVPESMLSSSSKT